MGYGLSDFLGPLIGPLAVRCRGGLRGYLIERSTYIWMINAMASGEFSIVYVSDMDKEHLAVEVHFQG